MEIVFITALLLCIYGLLNSLPRREYIYTRAEKRELDEIDRRLKELDEIEEL